MAQKSNTQKVNITDKPGLLKETPPFNKNNSKLSDSTQFNIDNKFPWNLTIDGNITSPINTIFQPTILTRTHGFLSCLQGDGQLPENQTGTGLGFSKIFLEMINPCLVKQGFSEIEADNGMMRMDLIFDSVSPLLLAPLAQIRNGLLYQDPLRFPHTDEANIAKLYNSFFLPTSLNESTNNASKTKSDTSLKEALLNPFFLKPLKIGKGMISKNENKIKNVSRDQQDFSFNKTSESSEKPAGISKHNKMQAIVPVTSMPPTLQLKSNTEMYLKHPIGNNSFICSN